MGPKLVLAGLVGKSLIDTDLGFCIKPKAYFEERFILIVHVLIVMLGKTLLWLDLVGQYLIFSSNFSHFGTRCPRHGTGPHQLRAAGAHTSSPRMLCDSFGTTSYRLSTFARNNIWNQSIMLNSRNLLTTTSFGSTPSVLLSPHPFICQPDEVLDDFEHDGFVERSRRAIAGGKHSRGSTGREEIRPGVPTYTLENLGGAPCIKAQTDCLFKLEYQVKQIQ